MNVKDYNKKGFTLLELMLVVGILAILSSISINIYFSFTMNTELRTFGEMLIFDLKSVRAKSMAGERGMKWGVHFINTSSNYYETFYTPTNYADVSTTIDITVYLPARIYFTIPASGNSSTIIFNKILGTTADTSTVVINSTNGSSKTINITPVGNVY